MLVFAFSPVAIWLTSSFVSSAAWAPASWHPHLSRAASGAPDASHVLESINISHNHKHTPFPPERLTPQPRLRLLPRTATNLWVVAARACPSNLCSPSWWPCPAQPLQHQCQWQWQYQCQCQCQAKFQRQRQCQSQCQRQCQSQHQRQRSCGYRPRKSVGTIAAVAAT